MRILSDNPKNFAEQVDDDTRDRASVLVHDALRKPENIERWMLALKKTKRDIESQLAADKASRAEKLLECMDSEDGRTEWLTYKARQDRWRADTIRVKNGTENKLDEATVLYNSLVNELFEAILNHRNSFWEAKEDEPTDEIDKALWSVLET